MNVNNNKVYLKYINTRVNNNKYQLFQPFTKNGYIACNKNIKISIIGAPFTRKRWKGWYLD